MPAVTQRIPNYLGGVSKQSDEKLLSNQVRECINGYPDPTFGLVKRSGTGYLSTFDTEEALRGAKWFFYQRDGGEAYFGAIKDKNIRMWNAFTFEEGTVTITDAEYLDTTKEYFDILSVQDTSIITNKEKVVEAVPAPAFVENTEGTIRLLQALFGSVYSVTLNGQTVSMTTPEASTGTLATAEEILTLLKDGLDGLNIPTLVVTKLNTTLELKCDTPMTLSTRGGPNNDLLVSFLTKVGTVAELPLESVQGRTVNVINSYQNTSNFYTQFIATDGISGPGLWEEARNPGTSEGLVNSTMPHELVSTGVNTFTFGPINWTKRLTGDQTSNGDPSFVGQKISKVFFYNTRLGVLSRDNVILSQTGEFYNFFNVSALTQVASDPVDVSVQSIKPATLFSCLPVTQGLLLFSGAQQFMLYADNGILTPNTTIIRSISYYEMDDLIEPVDVGTNVTFLSKSPITTQAYGMVTQGQDDNPIVVEISRVVSEYIPNTIEDVIASPQNSFIALYSSNSRTAFFYRTYNNGEKDLMQSWFKWELPGNIQIMTVVNDMLVFVTAQAEQTTLGTIAIDQIPNRAVVVPDTPSGVLPIIGNPCIDMFAQATDVTYDPDTKQSKCYIPYNDIDYLTPIIYLANETLDNPIDAGWYVEPEETGTDANGNYFVVYNEDLSVVKDRVIVGYKYALEIELPTIYYRPEENITDYTAALTVGRVKFACGLNGSFGFKIKSRGREEWEDVLANSRADYYIADTTPIVGSEVFVIPINQRSTNYSMKLYSDTPYPVSLNSMTWEGNYSPRFYRRK